MNIIMDLDLNQEPLDLATDSVWGSTCDEVEERIKLLEVVYARSRCRQTRPPLQNPLVSTINDTQNEGRGVKRDSFDLVAKALNLDTDVTKVVGDGKSFFDCNICLGTVKDPVLTCCGHLFCWECFYMLPCVYGKAKECPVCDGEVTEATITPIYGGHAQESCSGARVPPRPRANRIEVVKKTRPAISTDSVSVADVFRRIRMSLGGAMAGRHVPRMMTDGQRRHRSGLIARALLEVDDVPTSSALARVFSGEDLLVGGDDVAADEIDNGSSVGFLLESPVADTAAVAELPVNESIPSRRRNPRVRRRGWFT